MHLVEEFDEDLTNETVDLKSMSVVFYLRDALDNALLEDEGEPLQVGIGGGIRDLVMFEERFEELDDLGWAL